MRNLIPFLLALLLMGANSAKAQKWAVLYDSTTILGSKGESKAALALSDRALMQAEAEFGKAHTNYCRTLLTRGVLLQRFAQYKETEKALTEAIKLIEANEEAKKELYGDAMAIFANLYRVMSQYDKAITYAQKGVQYHEQIWGKNSKQYTDPLIILGNIYAQKGDHTNAVETLNQVLLIRSKLFPHNHPKYIEAINSLGFTYSNMGDYIRAEPLLEEAVRLRKQILGVNHLSYWYSLNNLSSLYIRMGSIQKAIELDREVVERAGLTNPGSEIHVSSLNGLINEYSSLKQYERADSVAQIGLDVIEQKTGKANRFYGMMLYNRARSFDRMGQFQRAENLYRQALDSYQKVTAENETLINSLKALAILHSKTGQYRQADSLFTQCLLLAEQVFGPQSLPYASVNFAQAQRFLLQQRPDDAFTLSQKANAVLFPQLKQNLPYWSTSQRQAYIQQWLPDFATTMTVAEQLRSIPSARQSFYDHVLFQKNLLLAEELQFSNTLQHLNSPALVALFDSVTTIRTSIARQLSLPITQRKNLTSLETRAETLEKELARQSAPFRQAQKELHVRWQDVRAALKATEATVEFMSFPYYNGQQLTDSVRYIALVLRPGDESPQVVPLLADEAPLRQLLIRKGAGHGSLYATRGSELDTDQLTKGDSLYQLIWQPIDKLLKGVKTVYISPSGLLHQVAFAALPYSRMNGKKTGFLADQYQLRQVGSTRQIVTASSQEEAFYQGIDQAKLYGGIRYDSVDTQSAKTWPFLPGTLREVDQISQLIGPKAKVVTGSDASEASIKSLSGKSPSVLHIATHGFTFPDPTTIRTDSSLGGNTFRQISNPLFRSGLLMAGSNRIWQGAKPALGEEDGILTAYEVANLDLSNTKLVVLSACETALGDIRGSEGVFGLQRAFKMAGVDYLVVSLWPVADDVTTTLMTLFYQNWKRYKTIRTAFQKTQSQMRKMYPPSVWAAFVLVE